MDDQSEMMQDYEITIESMRREVVLLTNKLKEPMEKSRARAEYEKCEEVLEIYKQDIEGHTADVMEEMRKLRALRAEEEWVKVTSPEFQETKRLEERIVELSQKVLGMKKERLEHSSSLAVEQLKETNVKLYNHVKRAFKTEQLNLDLKEEQYRIKQERKQLRLQYYKITKAFAGEERLKQKLKETEIITEEKGKFVDALTKELSDLQEKIQVTKKNIQNVEVKKLLLEYNEVKAIKERLAAKKEQVLKDIAIVQDSLENAGKHPEKVTPSAANRNLRKEIQQIEAQIIDASKEIKEKEKELFQEQFKLEEAKNFLKEVTKPIEIPPRSSLSRKMTGRTGSPSSPQRNSLMASSERSFSISLKIS